MDPIRTGASLNLNPLYSLGNEEEEDFNQEQPGYDASGYLETFPATKQPQSDSVYDLPPDSVPQRRFTHGANPFLGTAAAQSILSTINGEKSSYDIPNLSCHGCGKGCSAPFPIEPKAAKAAPEEDLYLAPTSVNAQDIYAIPLAHLQDPTSYMKKLLEMMPEDHPLRPVIYYALEHPEQIEASLVDKAPSSTSAWQARSDEESTYAAVGPAKKAAPKSTSINIEPLYTLGAADEQPNSKDEEGNDLYTLGNADNPQINTQEAEGSSIYSLADRGAPVLEASSSIYDLGGDTSQPQNVQVQNTASIYDLGDTV